jgi:phosphate starvation-inducible protein PhoH and related proteins
LRRKKQPRRIDKVAGGGLLNKNNQTKEKVSSFFTLTKVRDLQQFFGSHDDHLGVIERAFNVSIAAHGYEIRITGDSDDVIAVKSLINDLEQMDAEGYVLSKEEIVTAIRNAQNQGGSEKVGFKELLLTGGIMTSKSKKVYPKTPTQKKYVDAIHNFDLVFGIGPAGTGKTYLAVALAVTYLLSKKVSRIVLARPAVEAGENLGFLPGDMYQKVNPYLRPLHDALYDLVDMERANRMMERDVIEIAPLAFMRGRTLNDSFIILDEAQNTTPEQMKMFLTRLGYNAKAVVTGDITQIDLPKEKKSGLVQVQHILDKVPSIRFVYFEKYDVVRCRLVQDIVHAYEIAESNVRTHASKAKSAIREDAALDSGSE